MLLTFTLEWNDIISNSKGNTRTKKTQNSSRFNTLRNTNLNSQREEKKREKVNIRVKKRSIFSPGPNQRRNENTEVMDNKEQMQSRLFRGQS